MPIRGVPLHWSEGLTPTHFSLFLGSSFMPANPLTGYFLVPPSVADALAHEADVRERAAALLLAKRRSKVERATPTISVFLRETTLGLEKICDALLTRHQLRVNKSTLSRFIRSHPILSAIRQSKKSAANTVEHKESE